MTRYYRMDVVYELDSCLINQEVQVKEMRKFCVVPAIIYMYLFYILSIILRRFPSSLVHDVVCYHSVWLI